MTQLSEVRARATDDIVILVVAADDGLQPQTEEAISHAEAAYTHCCCNKMDREEADIEKERQNFQIKN